MTYNYMLKKHTNLYTLLYNKGNIANRIFLISTNSNLLKIISRMYEHLKSFKSPQNNSKILVMSSSICFNFFDILFKFEIIY